MAVQAITQNAYAQDYTPTTEIRNKNQTLDQNAFLNLLVAQLKYQDPLNPMDNKESISQMANFSALEQMQNLNQSFQKFSNEQRIINMTVGAEFIGKHVEGTNNGEPVNGYVISSSFRDSQPLLRLQNEDGEISVLELKDLTRVSISEEIG